MTTPVANMAPEHVPMYVIFALMLILVFILVLVWLLFHPDNRKAEDKAKRKPSALFFLHVPDHWKDDQVTELANQLALPNDRYVRASKFVSVSYKEYDLVLHLYWKAGLVSLLPQILSQTEGKP